MDMSISIDSISSYIDATKSAASGSELEKTLGKNLSSSSDTELMDVCKEFEAYFFEQVLKEVEKTLNQDEGDSSAAQLTNYHKESLRQELSMQLAEESGNTLAQTMYEQMKRNYNL